MKHLLVICAALLANCQNAAADLRHLPYNEPVVLMVLQEANNEPLAGMVAVANTVYERVKDKRWPNTARKVVYQPAQYSGMARRVQPYSPAAIRLARVAVALSRDGTRPCGKVNHYHADYIKTPKWTKRYKFVCKIGRHIFYGDK